MSESNNNQHNSIYYNKMLRSNEKKRSNNPVKERNFSSRKIDFSRYLIVPSGYEGIVYALYFILIPYVVGITFLFFYVAKAAYTNFALLDLSSVFIVWAIGYEITGAIILFFIFLSFIKHLQNTSR
ncbi:MAG: hypothetical protein ACI9TV_002825 [Sulfurimonas sp.]|jgi:hypothetical protein|uniref:hypothetical protein n=1 Tax=Sulfurimonas sp. TaxID=2022749 RepID=UPI0039E45F60